MGKIINFFKDVRRELKKVVWPNRQELTTYTSVVLVTVGVVTLIVWVLDSLYLGVLDLIF
ncbi:MAG: preprotein translocase subunit SecE [Firmicutes bacterium]|nr:preprotein translocase subunit SecE [Bacillota bacterium]